MVTIDNMSLQNKHLRNGDYFAVAFLLTNCAKNGPVGAPYIFI